MSLNNLYEKTAFELGEIRKEYEKTEKTKNKYEDYYLGLKAKNEELNIKYKNLEV